MKKIKDNIISYIILVIICIGFAFAKTRLDIVSNILGWVFIILTCGFFYFLGGHTKSGGYFLNVTWKIFIIIMVVGIFFIDWFLIKNIEWYSGYNVVAYYIIFTIGLLFKKNNQQQL